MKYLIAALFFVQGFASQAWAFEVGQPVLAWCEGEEIWPGYYKGTVLEENGRSYIVQFIHTKVQQTCGSRIIDNNTPTSAIAPSVLAYNKVEQYDTAVPVLDLALSYPIIQKGSRVARGDLTATVVDLTASGFLALQFDDLQAQKMSPEVFVLYRGVTIF
jgi:hypothetical protein